MAPVKPLFFEGFSPLSGEEIGVLTVLLRDPRGLEDENRQETFVSFRVLPGVTDQDFARNGDQKMRGSTTYGGWLRNPAPVENGALSHDL